MQKSEKFFDKKNRVKVFGAYKVKPQHLFKHEIICKENSQSQLLVAYQTHRK